MSHPPMELLERPKVAYRRFQDSLLATLLLLLAMWSVKVYELRWHDSLSEWGLAPRTAKGLLGVFSMPFLHKDLSHLYHNSFGILVLGLGLFYLYPRVAWRVLVGSTLAGGLLVWCFARDSLHIGASGVVYALSAFIFLGGCLRHDRKSRGGALVVALLYGAAVWGVFPFQQGISWEGHLAGALAGIFLAIFYRSVDLPARDEIRDDEGGADPALPYWLEGTEDEISAGEESHD